MLLTDKEYLTMKRYEKSDIIDRCDRDMLEKLASMGLVSYSLKFQDICYEGSARLTKSGLALLNREKILRSPIKRFLSDIINYI